MVKIRQEADKLTFATRWFKWWDAINPVWRDRRFGKFVLGGLGDWSVMYVKGKNGWLNIIAGLIAMRDVTDAERWEYALRDVHWVIGQVLAGFRYVAPSDVYTGTSKLTKLQEGQGG